MNDTQINLNNAYAKLGAVTTDDKAAINRKYRKLALAFHPDKHAPAQRQEAENNFIAIQRAYDLITEHLENQNNLNQTNFNQNQTNFNQNQTNFNKNRSKRFKKINIEDINLSAGFGAFFSRFETGDNISNSLVGIGTYVVVKTALSKINFLDPVLSTDNVCCPIFAMPISFYLFSTVGSFFNTNNKQIFDSTDFNTSNNFKQQNKLYKSIPTVNTNNSSMPPDRVVRTFWEILIGKPAS